MNVNKILELLKDSFCEIISESELKTLLSLKRDIVIKVGFDPTTSQLHLGHVVLLRKLKLFQDFGYKICFLIGDFTAMIGDPSGRSEVRNQICRDDVVANFGSYSQQIFKILDPNLTKILFNSSWLTFLSIDSFLSLMANITVSRLIERSDFKSRYTSNKPIYLHEFVYPLLQSYDSIFMNADIEFGGIDQRFNFVLARGLQKKFGYASQVIIMVPILMGLDGKNKMSKSLSNCVNINDDFYSMFCKIMSIPDFLVKDYYLFLNFVSIAEYESLLLKFDNFMALKFDLASRVVSLFYDFNLAEKAKCRFINYFSNKNFFDDVDVTFFELNKSSIQVSDFLVSFDFISSFSEFKRFVKQKSIEIDFLVLTDRNFVLKSNIVYFIKIGKKKVFKIFLKN